MRESLIVLDADLKVVSANKSFYQVFKVNPNETIGRSIYDLGNRQWDIPKLRQALGEIIPNKSSLSNYEINHNFEIIGVKFMLVNAVCLTCKKHILITIDDITERRKAEEEIKENAELKSKFTAMVSHELRSPLTVIKEGINLVLDGLTGEVSSKQKEILETAKNNTDRLGRLINNVLDFQKVQAGKMGLDILENDINETVLEACKSMSVIIKGKGLDLVVDVDRGIPKIKFDKDKIIGVFINLLSNAIKYTEQGKININVAREDNLVHVKVRDTGTGIKNEDMRKLFQPFGQLESVNNRKNNSTGLGLAISKEMILLHKGKIWAESEFGKGSTFHFTLPVKERRG